MTGPAPEPEQEHRFHRGCRCALWAFAANQCGSDSPRAEHAPICSNARRETPWQSRAWNRPRSSIGASALNQVINERALQEGFQARPSFRSLYPNSIRRRNLWHCGPERQWSLPQISKARPFFQTRGACVAPSEFLGKRSKAGVNFKGADLFHLLLHLLPSRAVWPYHVPQHTIVSDRLSATISSQIRNPKSEMQMPLIPFSARFSILARAIRRDFSR